MKIVALSEFLTDAQLRDVLRLYRAAAGDHAGAVGAIQAEVIEPNMAAIDEKLGQANDARFLAYMIVATLQRAERMKKLKEAALKAAKKEAN